MTKITHPFVVTYGSDDNRSAGDWAYRRQCDARRAFNAMIRKHPDAEMWMHHREYGCLGRTLLHYDPACRAIHVNRPARMPA